jgi:hypothetical protein
MKSAEALTMPRWSKSPPTSAGYYFLRCVDEFERPPDWPEDEPILVKLGYTSEEGEFVVGYVGRDEWYQLTELPDVEWWPIQISPPPHPN